MGYTKKVPGSPDLLFPTDGKWGHVNHSYHICLKTNSYITLSVTDKNTFTHTSRGAGTQDLDYTGYFNLSAQTQIHQHTPNQDIKQVVNMVLNVHRNHKACLGQEQERKGGVEVGEGGNYMTISTLSPPVWLLH